MKPKAVANLMNSQTYHFHRVTSWSSKATASVWWPNFLSSSLIWKARSENLNFSIHFLSFWYCRITENVWKNQGFLKTDHGLLCTPDLVYCFFELVSYSFQRESIEYMNSGRNSGLWILIQIFEFPAILPCYPWCQTRTQSLFKCFLGLEKIGD